MPDAKTPLTTRFFPPTSRTPARIRVYSGKESRFIPAFPPENTPQTHQQAATEAARLFALDEIRRGQPSATASDWYMPRQALQTSPDTWTFSPTLANPAPSTTPKPATASPAEQPPAPTKAPKEPRPAPQPPPQRELRPEVTLVCTVLARHMDAGRFMQAIELSKRLSPAKAMRGLLAFGWSPEKAMVAYEYLTSPSQDGITAFLKIRNADAQPPTA